MHVRVDDDVWYMYVVYVCGVRVVCGVCEKTIDR